ncbi:MAG: YHS domain-containing (seleno)protein [Cyclobacteriaceae bacterium]
MRFLSILTFCTVVLFSCGSSSENLPDIFQAHGVALDGYDVVAYHTDSVATHGDNEHRIKYNGATYAFSSQKNLDLFKANPKKYLPAYGGWCAYAVAAKQVKMAPNLEMWQIQDGRLIFFFDNIVTKITGNLQDKWNEDPKWFESKSDVEWERMTK